ncbi:MAG TPA: hypothetical protein PLE93_11150, partial [Solirubrobacterales bacterium]|nr:hypothetical protein [Solirubrobacterales bacterium]
IPIVGQVRGTGHFWAIEVVRDQETKEPFKGEAAEELFKNVLSEALWERGLLCRLDDRADPIIQIAPPLIAEGALFEEIAGILREGLEITAKQAGTGSRPDHGSSTRAPEESSISPI